MTCSLRRGSVCLLLLLLTVGVRAQNAPAAAVPLPTVGGDLLAGSAFSPPGSGALMTTVPTTGSPGGATKALHITVSRPSDPDYLTQLTQIVPTALPDQAVLRLHFWARSATRHRVRAVFEKSSDPYTKALNQPFALTNAWKEYAFVFTTPAYPAGGSAVHFVVGQEAGTLELAGIRLEYYGVNPTPRPADIALDLYGGLPHDDAWRKAANARIRKYRMGDLVVRVVDARGRPVPGARVHVRQTRHAFKFGTAVADGPLFAQTPDGEKYRQTLLRLFNYVVLENALKWDFNNFGTADRMLTWCAEHDLPVRGHNLFWPSYGWLPGGVKELRGEAMRQAVHNHVVDYVSRTKGRVVVWDVVNEAVTSHEVYDEAGKDLIAQAFRWAHETDPNVALCYNENTIFDMQGGISGVSDKKVDALLHYLIDEQHAPVNELGIQAHMGVPLVPAPVLLQNLDHWASYKLPIEITEYDAGVQNDEAHGQYQNEFMTAVFSHPSVHSFVQWGFWAGAHWRASEGGAMINKDWTPRPAEQAYERLVFHDWWTNTQGVTNKAGTYRVRAFLGTHNVTVTKGGRTKTVPIILTKNGDGQSVVTVAL